MKPLASSTLIALAVLTAPAAAAAAPGDSATGSGTNEFLIAVGNAHLSVAAHDGPNGPTGHVRAKGDPDGAGPVEPFSFEGAVTCIRVSGNRAAIKYDFKHATGSGAPFVGGGVQIFIEDNGSPSGGQAVDRSTFDAPQPAGVFQLNAGVCDDPNTRPGYDEIQSGNFNVHDAAP